MVSIKNKVEPKKLEQWFIENKEVVYTRSVEAAKKIVEEKLEQEILLEFYWDSEVYSKIFMSRKDIKTAMQKSLEYFISLEMFEKAQEIKNITDIL